MESKPKIKTKEDLIKAVLSYNPKADTDLISRAYDFSKQAHRDQERESGDGYFTHCLAVAEILVEMKASSKTIAAGLLHDVIEDTNTSPQKLKKEFGEEVLEIVESVTKIRHRGK